jgi:hypothetical protein
VPVCREPVRYHVILNGPGQGVPSCDSRALTPCSTHITELACVVVLPLLVVLSCWLACPAGQSHTPY